jgi:hypothetical protein
MSGDLYRSPSLAETAERLASGELEQRPRRLRCQPPAAVPVVPAFTPDPSMTRPDPQPEVPGRLPCCETCGFLEDALGHAWACLAPDGRLR